MAEIDERRPIDPIITTSPNETISLGETKEPDKVRARIVARVAEAQGFLADNFATNADLFYNQYRIMKPKPNADGLPNHVLPVIFGIIQSKLAAVLEQILPERNFYALTPKKSNVVDETTGEVKVDYDMTARLFERLAMTYLDDMEFYTKYADHLLDKFIWKYAGLKLFWRIDKGEKKYFDIREGKLYEVTEKDNVYYDGADCEAVSPYDLLIDPYAPSAKKARYIIQRIKVEVAEIKANKIIYAGPDVKECLTKAEQTKSEVLECYEYQERGRLAVITKDGHYLIRDHANPNKNGESGYFVNAEYKLQRTYYGISTAEVLSDIQIFESDITNLEAQQALLSVLTPLLVDDDVDLSAKNLGLRAGKPIVRPAGRENAIQTLKIPGQGQSGDQIFNRFQGVINQAVGNQEMMNPTGLGAGINDTATGAAIINQNLNAKNSAFARKEREQIVKPFLKMLIESIQQYLTLEQAVKRLGEAAAKSIKLEPAKIDWNASFDYSITGEDGRLTKQQQLGAVMGFSKILKELPELKQYIKGPELSKKIISAFNLPESVILTQEEIEQQQQGQGELSPDGGTAADPADVDKMAEVIAGLVQQTGQSEEQIGELLKQGKTPTDIMQMTQGGGV